MTPNGFVFSWGLNVFGQLGLGDFVDRCEPQQVKKLSEYCVQGVAAGYLHSAIHTDQGKLFSWGHNPDCRLMKKIEYYKGSGRSKNFANPQYCQPLENADIIQVSCGTSHTLALDSCGYIYAAGSSDLGQLGVIDYHFIPDKCERPYITMPGFTIADPAIKVCAGDGFSIALDSHGQVFSCGKGNFGRLG